MFHFAFAEIVQERLPFRIVFKIFRHVPGEKNVSRVAAIHHSLRHVNACPGEVGLFVQVSDFIDRATVNSHSHPHFRMTF